MAKDPVCGMTVDEKAAAASVEHHGQQYYFCSESCRAKFVQAPDRYAAGGQTGQH